MVKGSLAVNKTRKPRKLKYTNQQILDAIRHQYRLHEDCLTSDQYKDSRQLPNLSTAIKRFGSVKAVWKAAGLKVPKKKTNYASKRYVNFKTISIEELLEFLRHSLLTIGYIPLALDYSKMKQKPPLAALSNRGLTWRQSVEKAGFSFDKSREAGKLIPLDEGFANSRKYRDRARKQKLRAELVRLGRCPQCRKPWEEPKPNGRGKKPDHCRQCQIYYKERYEDRRRNVDES
ncbi:hypothetical protein [Paenibacillus donghaensis]|uniref:Uncharacterized protein n=1 Tax=Paenibacillus donghaensis TaxID=414771 RepID=A0A2Z2K6Y1_9BACL|nr:hypothetical protein [Paenibacillus donghaensis]ASA22056.1 hypothetical protein B9T62_15500 [Paenibacillus donghaensis]